MKKIMFIMKKTTLVLSVLAFSLTFNSCEKDFLETMPTNAISEAEAMKTLDGAMMCINGIHRLMYTIMDVSSYGTNARSQGYAGGIVSIWGNIESLGEDLVFRERPSGSWFEGPYQWSINNRDNSSVTGFPYMWYYHIIANANGIINRINEFEASDNDRNYILGQALAYRAYAHFGLVQWFGRRYEKGGNNSVENGGVVIVTRDPTEPQGRSTVAQVYTQINTDLDEAIRLLTDNSSAANRKQKSHINANVANGLKARVALVQQYWDVAARHARLAREGFPMATKDELLNGFYTVDAREWIWGSRHIAEQSTAYHSFASHFSMNSLATNASVSSQKLINKELYENMDPNDIRREWWIYDNTQSRYSPLKNSDPVFTLAPYSTQKFRVNGSWSPTTLNEMIDLPLMRGSEMFLIEAEAEAQDGRYAAARIVLETFMSVRVPGYTTSGIDDTDLLNEIWDNRRIELWGEGHRWLDLKRQNEGMRRTPEQGHLQTLIGGATFNVFILPNDSKWNLWLPRYDIDPSKGKIVQNL
jgi:hypothetical protein